MKEKVIIFVVGLLLGAIISTGSIYIYTVANKNNTNNNIQVQGMQMPSGGDMNNTDTTGNAGNTTPPEKPTENNNNNS